MPRKKRVAYILWHFPILSQTYIVREIHALNRAGLSVDIIADTVENQKQLSVDAETLLQTTHYLFPVNWKKFLLYFLYFGFRSMRKFVMSFFQVKEYCNTSKESFITCVILFAKAVYIAGILKDKNVNHLHAPWASTHAFLAMLAAQFCDITYTIHCRAFEMHRLSEKATLPHKLWLAKFVVTNSRYNESHLKSILEKHDCEKIHVIYEGLDLEKFQPGHKKEPQGSKIKILSVGRIVEQKGFEYLLEACKILAEQNLSFQCDIIGGIQYSHHQDYDKNLKRLIKNLKLDGCVIFHGSQPFSTVMKHYMSSDVFVLPCVILPDGNRDITPNVLIEAMAMKIPVVSTNITAIPEIVDHGVNGLLVPPADEQSLASALHKLIRSPELRKQFGKNARKKIEVRFNLEQNIQKYIALFDSLNL